MKRVKAREVPDTPVTEEVVRLAVKRGQAVRGTKAIELIYDAAKKALHFQFADRVELGLPIAHYAEFAGLSDRELGHLRLAPGGTAILLDEKGLDVSIPGLLASTPLVGGLAARIAAVRNGRVSSDAKAAAARENGKRGGRPPRP